MSKESINRKRPHAVVIGSGFGGLAAAVRIGARGYRVTVCDRLDAPGGRARVHHQDGFRFDAGPTIITAPQLFEELWQLCGRRLRDEIRLRPLRPFYTIRFADGAQLECTDDREHMQRQIAAFSRRDAARFPEFLKACAAIYAVAFTQLAHRPFGSMRDMLRMLPQLARLRGDRSVYALAAQFFESPQMRFAASFHPLFVGGNPFKTTAIYGLIPYLEHAHGVHFAMGGTGVLAEGLASLISAQGNELRFDTEVTSICVERGRATGVGLRSGERIRADIVICNGDSAWAYRHLISPQWRRRWTNDRLERAKYSMGIFVWYFGTRRRYEAIPHHLILVGPRYRELLVDIFDRQVLAEDFSLYLHRPTATDPSLAPPGCDAFYVLSPVPNLEADIDWRTQAEPYRRKIAAFLEGTVLPGLDAALATSRLATPLDFERDLLSFRGAGFGLQPLLMQSAWFRPHNRSEDIEGLYLVGAGTHPGAGLPGVLSSAKVLESLVPYAATA